MFERGSPAPNRTWFTQEFSDPPLEFRTPVIDRSHRPRQEKKHAMPDGVTKQDEEQAEEGEECEEQEAGACGGEAQARAVAEQKNSFFASKEKRPSLVGKKSPPLLWGSTDPPRFRARTFPLWERTKPSL